MSARNYVCGTLRIVEGEATACGLDEGHAGDCEFTIHIPSAQAAPQPPSTGSSSLRATPKDGAQQQETGGIADARIGEEQL